jgi:hypothetical protein
MTKQYVNILNDAKKKALQQENAPEASLDEKVDHAKKESID